MPLTLLNSIKKCSKTNSSKNKLNNNIILIFHCFPNTQLASVQWYIQALVQWYIEDLLFKIRESKVGFLWRRITWSARLKVRIVRWIYATNEGSETKTKGWRVPRNGIRLEKNRLEVYSCECLLFPLMCFFIYSGFSTISVIVVLIFCWTLYIWKREN